MGRTWIVLLEIAPVAKGRPRFSKNRTFTPKKTKDFETTAKQLMKAQFFLQPLEGPLQVTLEFLFERPKRPKHKTHHIVRPDCDNLAKAVLDAGNNILFMDDSQVCELRVLKRYATPPMTPRIVLTLTELDGV